MRFTLYDLDPDFWARVVAKAKAEGLTVKGVIMKLLTTWLGVFVLVVLALLLAGCGASPTAPSPTVTPAPVVAPPPAPVQTPAPSGPPFTIHLDAAAGQAYASPFNQWQTLLHASLRTSTTPPPDSVTIDCGNGTPAHTLAGFDRLQWTVFCLFPTPGTYTVVATAVANTGFAAQDTTTVVVAVLPAPAPPSAPPSQGSGALTAQRINGGTTFAEWGFTLNSGLPLVNFNWDFGDQSGSSSSVNHEQHVYRVAGPYTVRVSATTANGGGLTSVSKDIIVAIP